ncbi:unannotated protein [freshwater metagenome]|uniref:Unannotated protein n=1 Tax=freshwater metagenome TaxID=449393 RepID=A0A6J7C2Y5_9ZZZZ
MGGSAGAADIGDAASPAVVRGAGEPATGRGGAGRIRPAREAGLGRAGEIATWTAGAESAGGSAVSATTATSGMAGAVAASTSVSGALGSGRSISGMVGLLSLLISRFTPQPTRGISLVVAFVMTIGCVGAPSLDPSLTPAAATFVTTSRPDTTLPQIE